MTVPKFRVWDTVKKSMSEVQAIVYAEKKVYPIYSKVVRRYVPFSEAVLMQSTGLKDKNGTEIFEWDVVRYTVVNQAMCGIYEVRQAKSGAWRMDNAIQGRELWLAKPHSLEVLGNIHQHQYLLKELGDG